ncbi:Sterol desaturase/sphingolipid hydroxylase, fatty acid hydroxylase superfamily [Parasphingorhabdus marina DSM 22363]|uniref:Sterol desaturase/sphingolipid hydroxylase, fatty acid hydroxylase superfamily n=1 Tax=Parasphingorhabdus marina DSM 22363 TaxID=1123272 RepID=A0A1N6H3P2_9SPHN|nr:sterol desaturase family protein [Parasphingorhabdus marina]SIO14438.1 Sterol desaturase/sphingolipid hydroxylase, fatty acid hydroxylase superfamily [Parasphingorhabdus marina DSM 22363]
MESLPDPTLYAIPFFVLTVAIGFITSMRHKDGRYDVRDMVTSLTLGTGSVFAGILTGGLALAVIYWVYQFRLFDVPFTWWAWILAFFVDDFFYYVFHRAAHRIRWVWAAHVNHHSSQYYNLSTALRQPWTSTFALTWIFSLPMFLIGFHPAMIAFVGGINLLYQYWIHTEAIDRMPRWFEAVMNTPSHHRVHHATNPRYLDKNYAGILIIWDKMFGTFEAERDDEQIKYGIIKNLENNNIIWAAFHEWVGMAKDLWAAPWRYKLNYLIKPPGWSHDGSRDSSETIRARWQEEQNKASS